MEKATRFTVLLSLWVIALFGGSMMLTFINDAIQASGFFGDVPGERFAAFIDDGYYWGARHYWYYWMCFTLFCLAVSRIIIWIRWYWREELGIK